MTTVYLALGSNLGDRRDGLRRAIATLRDDGLEPRRLSPVVESPAQSDWERAAVLLRRVRGA